MTTIHFLEANVPLTKSFTQNSKGVITKSDYPMATDFTSHSEEIETPNDLFKAIQRHAKLGHCLLKGDLTRPLVSESRRGTTRTDDRSAWVCLDFDRHECADLDEVLNQFGLGNVSYVLQYSSSHGLDDNMGTVSAHVFMLLSAPVPAPDLKAWLMELNLKYLRDDVRLSRSKSVLSWPLDITTCQNDKLLYIAPPIFNKPLTDPLDSRIQLVPKKLKAINVDSIGITHIGALKTEERKLLNELRKLEGLPSRTAKTSWVGPIEVQNKPDVCTVTGIKEQGEFIRLNLNGGDSWAYWHPKDNFEIIHDFKSDTYYRTKELVPGYYQELVEQRRELNATPTEDGDLILAFRDKRTATYHNGIWNPEQQKLELYPAKNETQLEHWMRSHGRTIGDYIPIWDIGFNPREEWVVDEDNHRINLFRKTDYMRLEADPKRTPKDFPNIYYIVRHMLGESGKDTQLSDHFLNWFAVIFQRKEKPITAWVTHGTEGTGKGYFMKRVVRPLLGNSNVVEVGVGNLEDQFNSFLEQKLFILVNEVDVDDFKEKGRVEAKLKMLITEDTAQIRGMRQAAVEKENWASLLFNSNKKRPVFIPPNDRRYNVGNLQAIRLTPPKEKDVEAELEAFAEWLLAHKADVKKAGTVLDTEARRAMQKLNMTSLEETCEVIKKGDFELLWLAMPDEDLMNRYQINNQHTQNAQAYCMLMRDLARRALDEPNASHITRDELMVILQYNVGNIPQTPNKFTSLLRHNGIETERIRVGDTRAYGLKVKWDINPELRQELLKTLKPSKQTLRKVK